MFGRIRPEFQCFDGYAQNSNVNVWKDKVRILMFGQICSEFKC